MDFDWSMFLNRLGEINIKHEGGAQTFYEICKNELFDWVNIKSYGKVDGIDKFIQPYINSLMASVLWILDLRDAFYGKR
jgi:hypothetical protein